MDLLESFGLALAAALPKLIELFTHLGSRDAFLAALDGTLATARAKTDSDLTAKHAHDHDGSNPTPVTPPDHSAREIHLHIHGPIVTRREDAGRALVDALRESIRRHGAKADGLP